MKKYIIPGIIAVVLMAVAMPFYLIGYNGNSDMLTVGDILCGAGLLMIIVLIIVYLIKNPVAKPTKEEIKQYRQEQKQRRKQALTKKPTTKANYERDDSEIGAEFYNKK